jgi:hypothetical protein
MNVASLNARKLLEDIPGKLLHIISLSLTAENIYGYVSKIFKPSLLG